MIENAIWTEKYRPSTFAEVQGQKDIVKKVEAFVKQGNMPHVLFAGPAGVGKCITGDTPIMTGAGEVLPIAEAYKHGLSTVMTLDVEGRIKPGKVAYCYKSEADSLILLKTTAGKHLKVTKEHPFLVLKEGVPTWTEAHAIRTGTLVAVPECVKPCVQEQTISWERGFWAMLREEVLIRPNKLCSGVKRKVLAFLEGKRGSNTEISVAIKEKRGVVAWATSELIKEGLLVSEGERPLVFSATTVVKRREIPLCEVRDTSLVTKLFYKRGGIRSKGSISYFTEATPAFYEWLGLVFGDGHVRVSSIRFYNKNERLRQHFLELSQQVFGDMPWQESELPDVPYMELLSARPISALLESHYGIILRRKKSDIIKIPSSLFVASDECVAAFVRAYFECDGHCGEGGVQFSSASKELLFGLSYILLRWGIHARLRRKRRQYYLEIHDSFQVNELGRRIKSEFKQLCSPRRAETNVDIMEVATSRVRKVMSRLGIRHEELSMLGNNSHLFDRGRGSRDRVRILYASLCELARERLNQGLKAISLCDSLRPDIEGELENLFKGLGDSRTRSALGKECHIRYDRLKDYFDGRREPNLANTLKVLKGLQRLKKTGSEAYTRVMQSLILRKELEGTLRLFNISYAELARTMYDSAANISMCLNSDGLSFQSILKLQGLFVAVKTLVERRIYSEDVMENLELFQYLSQAELRWDTVNVLEQVSGDEVYDLNVEETHNFIGGHGALVLHNTTLSLVVARQLFGDEWRGNFLELNASDERGIDVVRVKVKDFARTRAIGDVPFKIIYLDECDALTKEAQQALRRTMENYTQTCRFILSCNYSSKIIDPIQSRCTVFRFKPLSKDELKVVVDRIVKGESLTVDAKAFDALVEVSGGDVRRVENILQACAALDKKVTDEHIFSIASYARPTEIKSVLDLSVKGDFLEARKQLLKVMLEYGLSGLDVVKQLQAAVWKLEGVEDKRKLGMIKACGEAEFRMVEGSDEFVQLEALLAAFAVQ
ncbi:replication factor C small subunit [Candidatus Woesearchaeota archaeon]|nr:replication factor C small subunit [Candidatus Woesearchaeota archaeon]